MINNNLYDALVAIYGTTDLQILEKNQTFVYGDTTGTPLDSSIPLITYFEEAKRPVQKGDKFIQGNDVDGYNYLYNTRYFIDVRIDLFGEGAEDRAERLVEVLNNNEDYFIEQQLGILGYGAIENLTFLENAEYTNRFAISIKIDYTLTREAETGYRVTQGS